MSLRIFGSTDTPPSRLKYPYNAVRFLIIFISVNFVFLLFNLTIACNATTADKNRITEKFEFNTYGKLIYRLSIGYLNFVDPVPKLPAHRAAAYLDRYLDSSGIQINETDLEQPDIKDRSQLINVFYGHQYFSNNSINTNNIKEKYDQMATFYNIPPYDSNISFNIYSKYCAVYRKYNNVEIGESIIVADDIIDEKDLEDCFYYGVSYSFGFLVGTQEKIPTDAIRRSRDQLVYSASRQCLNQEGPDAFAKCVIETISGLFNN
ncbi:hypothetical protein [Pleomorphomonas koreensis]|uniref:hypothetical protein n=1 Tax=Pleomorphomonas koreensis TaxID=257440 RepID=UPI0012EBF543|nr:hypothetical protein [Pleomorphomonas koreensis]